MQNAVKKSTSKPNSEVVRNIFALSEETQTTSSFLYQNLVDALDGLSFSEKLFLIKEFASNLKSKRNAEFIKIIIRSSQNLEQFCELVGELSSEGPQQNRELRELYALKLLYTEIRKLTLPLKLKKTASKEDLNESLSQIKRFLREMINLCAVCDQVLDTDIASLIIQISVYNLEITSSWEQESKGKNATISFVNTMLEKIDIERTYGLILTQDETNSGSPCINTKWTLQDLKQVRSTLERLPEGIILFTPLLTQIHKTESLGPSILGVRYPSGIIAISQSAIENPFISMQYENQSSLQVVLMHELGHSVQLGRHFSSMKADPLEALGQADVLFDFDQYIRIAHWEYINPERYNFEPGLQCNHDVVKVDGITQPLKTIVNHHGKKVVFIKHHNLLFSYNPEGEFNSNWYSQTTAGEDWAEAFCEYFMTPRRLLSLAPEKFNHFEKKFQAYKDNLCMQSELKCISY